MDLQVMTVLASIFSLATGSCDVYGNPDSTTIERCAQIQYCVSEALLNDRKNVYVLDRVFRSTESRPPVALVVNYHVTGITNDDNVTVDYNSVSSGSGINEESVVTDLTGEVAYIEQLGWSSTGIYKVIRPKVLILVQPVGLWWTLSFAIDNDGLPRSIHLKLNITNTTECELLKNITRVEMKEALEHLTEKLHYETSGKVWNTNTTSLQFFEIWLLIVMASLGIFTAILLLAILPSLNSKKIISWNGFFFLFPYYIIYISGDHYLRPINDITTSFSYIVSKHFYIPLASYMLGFLYGITNSRSVWCGSTSISTCFKRALAFGLTSWLAMVLAVYSIPVLIEAFIYPTEVISTIGFIVICIAGISAIFTTLKWFTRNGTCMSVGKEKKNRKIKHSLQMFIVGACSYLPLPCLGYGFLLLYLSLLRHRLESPTTQLIQTLLAFIPPIFAGFGSLFLRKILAPGTKDKPETTKIQGSETDKDTNISSSQTDLHSATEEDDTITSNNPTDPPHEDSPTDDQQRDDEQTTTPDIQQQEESPQESEEVQVTVEVHTDDVQESTV